MIELDYLVIGHVTRDLVDGAFTIGGTASYAALTARAMGCRVGVVTSADPTLDLSQVLEGALVARFPAAQTTTFENIATPDGRRQVLHGVAEPLVPGMVPPEWQPTLVHLGPVAGECDPALACVFTGAFVGLTPQGWMRRRDEGGHVRRRHWEEAHTLLARADSVVLSEEDIEGDQALAAQYAAQTRCLAVTRGAAGCTVYTAGEGRHFAAPSMREVDSTGAGDVFAAAFFVWMVRYGDPWTAACFANCIAACSVTRSGLAGPPSCEEISRCERVAVEQACPSSMP